MIRCGKCKVILKDGTPVCSACGTALDATGAPMPPASTPPPAVLPNQGQRGAGPVVPGQGGSAPARPGGTPPAGPAAPPPTPSVAPPVPPPAAPPVAPLAAPVARPAGPVVLGPASDPGVGSRSSGSFPGAGGTPPVGTIPVVVGPPPKDDGGGKGLKLAVIIGSSLVLVLLIALVVVLSSRSGEVVAADTSTTTSTSTTSTSTTTTTAPPVPAALTLNPFGDEYTLGDIVSFSAGFSGDPNAVKATALFVNGFPNLPFPGLNLNYEFPAATVGTHTVKVVATLQSGELRESNEVTVVVVAPPTTTVPTTQPPPPPTYACYGCQRITIRSGLRDVKLRAAPNTSSAVRGTVATGTPLYGDCRVTGEYISLDGRSTSTWDRLSDGSYIWDGFIVELLPPC